VPAHRKDDHVQGAEAWRQQPRTQVDVYLDGTLAKTALLRIASRVASAGRRPASIHLGYR
jgi:hypothetical protein